MARGLKRGAAPPVYAHRTAWELTNGPIPTGQSVLHHCDVPLCCNPAHLFLGTQADNMRDAARKGRLHVSRPSRHKLTDAQVSQVLARVASGEKQVALAREFNVTEAHISQLVNGRARKYRTVA